MLAARFHEYGDPDVLVVEEAAEPHATTNSVRIAVQAVSVNPIDYLLRSGALREVFPLALPAIPGRDAVGVIDELGEGVSNASVGDLVFGLGGVSDTTAEFAVLTAWSSVPSDWSTEHAAAAGLASATAVGVINALGDLTGRTLLIEGASGAVGSAAAAFALAAGARVIGTARPANHQYLLDRGIVATTYGPGLPERVSALAPEGVYAALHAAPSASLQDLVTIVGNTSRVVTVIDREGAARLGVRNVDAVNDSALLERAADLGRRGLYTPRVDHALPLASIRKAHELAESGAGKIVVTLT
ncbi:alcohol dehydrogenase catalytic domain-containing protein [Mycolicibacterium mengxianglii]|uniref:alcohol dehydrogenase catalytic domain-containing protein n=1 Tax=Mycolicibacterium mengxianglii TaxID=2736649 RepID=UPI0018D048FC|nr:alcohol dehydrogenase catalytic domain-containing protein [Mycolicibacterium mengxianglii]